MVDAFDDWSKWFIKNSKIQLKKVKKLLYSFRWETETIRYAIDFDMCSPLFIGKYQFNFNLWEFYKTTMFDFSKCIFFNEMFILKIKVSFFLNGYFDSSVYIKNWNEYFFFISNEFSLKRLTSS